MLKQVQHDIIQFAYLLKELSMPESDIKSISKPVAARRGIVRWTVQMLVSIAIFWLLLFVSAGRLDWMQGWTLFGINVLSSIISGIVLIKKRPELLGERSKAPSDSKQWDKLLAPLVAIFGTVAILVTGGLDARFGWSAPVSFLPWILGIILAFASQMFALWAMATNPYFATTVKIQTERGHQVVSGGPYSIVRHPGYLGTVFYNLSVPIVLSSIWTFIPSLITIILLMIRTRLEDRTLQTELTGYVDYAAKVRFKLFTGLW
jgi:protein-S-isoprenylcysteine O-methyltransferase Ste14